MEVQPKRGESAVVGEALENLADVGDPEGALEAGADFVETLAEIHFSPGWKRSDCTGETVRSKGAGGLRGVEKERIRRRRRGA